MCGLCVKAITRVGCGHIKNGSKSLQAVTVRVGENIRQPAGIEENTGCWTYSHHCQIVDMKPSKRSWNGEFRGFRICVGWISTTRFCVAGFYVHD